MDSLPGNLIHARRLDEGMSSTAHGLVVMVIPQDEDDVWFFSAGRSHLSGGRTGVYLVTCAQVISGLRWYVENSIIQNCSHLRDGI